MAMKSERTRARRARVLLWACAAWLVLHAVSFVSSCARMGSPDGGWFDDTPPHVVSASPADKATNVNAKKITILFNEFIKLDDPQNKVVVSPPQLEQAEIKASGKRIVIELKDSLKENTTYTVDFSDAISDNNEGNPMGNYTYSFSTGSAIDTFEVSGYVLSADALEPVKGILVGLYDDLSDTAFTTKPMIRVSRTDSRGRFNVKGVAPGTYRCYALQDVDGDFVYGQKSEMLAFSHDTFEPSAKPDMRQDTIWRDTLHIDNILRVPYTHFLPDDLTLLAFTAPQTDRYLIKTERNDPNKLGFYFTYGDSIVPIIRGFNFDADSAFVVESNLARDTITYWLRDTTLINQDTLHCEVSYHMTDTLGQLIMYADTLELVAKTPYEKRQKERERELERWQKEQDRKKKREEAYDSIYPIERLVPRLSVQGSMSPDQNISIEMPAPLSRLDTAAIHLYSKIDTLWYRAPFIFRADTVNCRRYQLLAEWRPGVEYSLEIDTLAFEDIYGLTSEPLKQGIKVKDTEDFGTLMVSISGAPDSTLLVQLLNSQGNPVKQVPVTQGVAEFYYVNPGKYYLAAFDDRNGNQKWDTGDYHADLQPEAVYYYSEEIECKAKFDITLSWNLTARPRYQQKPAAITKQKPDREKKQQNRNAQRAEKLGIEYVRKTTGVNL
ncbi:MAG: Ig-like domain-containing protein [Prevotella sp.]|nr:Ig-like domain-containing protein [Prevotella sp.]